MYTPLITYIYPPPGLGLALYYLGNLVIDKPLGLLSILFNILSTYHQQIGDGPPNCRVINAPGAGPGLPRAEWPVRGLPRPLIIMFL